MHMPSLQLGQRLAETPDDELNDLSSEDEAVANDLDMHALILGGLHTDDEPIKSAEEVIKEIDDIMDETASSENGDVAEVSEVMEKAKEVLSSPLYESSKCAMNTKFQQIKSNRLSFFAFSQFHRIAIDVNLTVEWTLHGNGSTDTRIFRNTYIRISVARRIGIRERDEKHIYFTVACGAE